MSQQFFSFAHKLAFSDKNIISVYMQLDSKWMKEKKTINSREKKFKLFGNIRQEQTPLNNTEKKMYPTKLFLLS